MTWSSPSEDLAGPAPRRLALALALAAVGASLLRAAPLFAPGGALAVAVNYDEGVYLTGSALLGRGFLPYRDFVFVHPPALLLFLLPLTALAHVDPATLLIWGRFLAVGLGALNTLLVGTVALRAFGPLAGVAAALLYATHPETVHEERGPFLEPVLNALCLAMAEPSTDGKALPQGRAAADGDSQGGDA